MDISSDRQHWNLSVSSYSYSESAGIYLRGLPIVWILLSRLRRNQSGKCTACRTSSVSNLVSSTGNLYRCYLWRFYADTDSCQITYRWDQRMEVPWVASVCSCRNHDRKFYFEKHFAFGFSYFTMTVFAIFTYTEFFKHKSAEGEKMNKKNYRYHCLHHLDRLDRCVLRRW